MKKILFIAAAIAALGSCNNGGIPKANMKTELDTLSYEIGVANSQGAKMYIANQLGIDTAYMEEFYKGFASAAKASDDKKLAAYYAGVQIGQQIGTQVYAAANSELFGSDSTQTINLNQLIAGFIEGIKGEPAIDITTIKNELTKRIETYKNENLSKTYGENKKQSEEFIANKAKEEGVKKLPGGTLYKVLTEGKGAVPAEGNKVQVIYEGKTLDGNVFDSSEKNNGGKPTEIMSNQVIQGWKEALAIMPEGSEWELYVPYDQGYGIHDMGAIKPYSALIFKIKLVNANSDITAKK